MKKFYYISTIPGYWWSDNHNAIDWGNAFCRKGKSTDSAIMNPEKNGFGTTGSPKKRPHLKLMQFDQEIYKHVIKVSKNLGKSYTGIVVNEDYLNEILKKNGNAVYSIAIPSWDQEGNLQFIVPYFFTDEFYFIVNVDKDDKFTGDFSVERGI